MSLCFLLGTDLNCVSTPDFFSIFAKKLLKYCNFSHNIWQLKNRLKINIRMNAAIYVEPSHIDIWIESPTQISRILFISSCFLLKHWVCMEAWHSVMKLQHFMGKLVIQKIEQETTEVPADQKRMASSLHLAWTEIFDLTDLQLGRSTPLSLHCMYIDNAENNHGTTENLTAVKSKGILKSLILNRNCRCRNMKSFFFRELPCSIFYKANLSMTSCLPQRKCQ